MSAKPGRVTRTARALDAAPSGVGFAVRYRRFARAIAPLRKSNPHIAYGWDFAEDTFFIELGSGYGLPYGVRHRFTYREDKR